MVHHFMDLFFRVARFCLILWNDISNQLMVAFTVALLVAVHGQCQLVKLPDYNALNGSDTAGLRLETVGDLMGVLMVLCNSGILQISGQHGEDKMLKDDTVSIHLNPALSSYLEIGYTARGKAHTLSLQEALLNIKSYKVFNDLLKWEKMNYLYRSALKSAGNNPNEATQAAIDEIAETKEKVELQENLMLLDISDIIKVK